MTVKGSKYETEHKFIWCSDGAKVTSYGGNQYKWLSAVSPFYLDDSIFSMENLMHFTNINVRHSEHIKLQIRTAYAMTTSYNVRNLNNQ